MEQQVLNLEDFLIELEKIVVKAKTEQKTLTISYFDIGGFGTYNLLHTSKEADSVLGLLTGILSRQVSCDDLVSRIKEEDIILTKDLDYDFGGDEFIVAFYSKSKEETENLLYNISTSFSNSFGKGERLSLSYKAYEYSSELELSGKEILKKAFISMNEEEKEINNHKY
ncbi:MAG: GGDEF domain-containing protein [Nanoarchaeota archaeon]|nr:GGDEF domain-containing protein [Nanoarchaeota archaeon]